MAIVLYIIKSTLEEGFMYALLAMGVYITYSVLDFPDLSVEGTVPLGALVSAILIMKGVNPWLALLAAFIAGAAGGTITGLLHVKLKIQPLLCGILVMTALISVNLVVVMSGTGGSSLATYFNKDTIFDIVPKTMDWLYSYRIILVSLVLAVVFKVLLDAYLATKSGLLLRATGSNPQYVTMLARNPGTSKILGLAIGNGFSGLAGAVISQNKNSADTQMGAGMVVIGLASVIIGLSLMRSFRRLKATTKVIIGSIIYKSCLSIAMELGLPNSLLKLLMSILFVIALVSSQAMDKGKRKGKGGLLRA